MTCLTADQITDLQSDLIAVLLQITAMESAMVGAGSNGTKRYDFDSGTGRQSETFNDPLLMSNALDKLMARRDRLRRKLAGYSKLTLKLRR